MEQSLPYLVSPGSIKTALERIRQAATPERVTGDFVSTKLNIKGGTGRALIPFLKKIGLVASDGSPTELYRQFRNPSSGEGAIAEAIRFGYRKLAGTNEHFYDLKDADLLHLINQVTGAGAGNAVSKMTLSTFKNLKSFANFDPDSEEKMTGIVLSDDAPKHGAPGPPPPTTAGASSSLGLNLAYTINLNLPASPDQAVFNAIFRSLKEHLLVEPE